MSWIHVRLPTYPLSCRGACVLTGNDCVAQYVPLAYRRQPELPTRRARFPEHFPGGRVQPRFSIHSAGRRPHRVLRRRGAFSPFSSSLFYTNISLYRITLQRGIDVLVVCVFFAVRKYVLNFGYRKLTHRGTPQLSPRRTRSTSRAPRRRPGPPTRTSRPQDSCALPHPGLSISPWAC